MKVRKGFQGVQTGPGAQRDHQQEVLVSPLDPFASALFAHVPLSLKMHIPWAFWNMTVSPSPILKCMLSGWFNHLLSLNSIL